MKNVISVSFLLITALMVSMRAYAQSNFIQPYYNPSFSYQSAITSSNSWVSLNSGYSLTDFNPILQDYQNLFGLDRSSSLNISTSTGWFNHPPISTYSPTYPIVMKAGQSSTLAYLVIDPDGDRLYSSSSFGSTGSPIGGTLSWGFTAAFPGVYHVSTVVYDERGSFAVMSSPVSVKPWWSF